jgi:predicted ribosomally synthesized peptide with SipW-like signal peptide
MTHDEPRAALTLTRRKLLAGLGAAGLASTGAGLGTSAYFTDSEPFDGNSLAAGELDLKVDWQQYYYGPGRSEAYAPAGRPYVSAFPDFYRNDPNDRSQRATDAFGFPIQEVDGVKDPIMSRAELASRGVPDPEAAFRSQFADVPDYFEQTDRVALVRLFDVKPGDSGEVVFSLHLFDNPGYVWLLGELVSDEENGQTEPEAGDDPTDAADAGELAAAIRAEVVAVDVDDAFPNFDEEVLLSGSLRTVLETLSTAGVPLDGDPTTAGRDCVPDSTTQYVAVRWELPTTVGNEVQSDVLTFGLEFYAEQCRHSDGTTNPVTGTSVVPLSGALAPAFGFSPSGTTGSLGGSSWASDGPDKEELYLGPAFSPLDPLPSFTIGDVASVEYHTRKPGAASDPDFYLTVYTEPFAGGDASWYGYRLTAEPSYARDPNAPAGQWNRWSTDSGPNQLTFYDSNRQGIGFGYTDGTIPTLADLQAGPIDWSAYRSAAAATSIDYGSQPVKTMSVSTGSGWAAGFDGYLDEIAVRLTDGSEVVFDLRA